MFVVRYCYKKETKMPRRKQRSKKALFVTTAAVLTAGLVVGGLLWRRAQNDTSNQPVDGQSQESLDAEQQDVDDKKQEILKNEQNTSAQTTDQVPTNQVATVSITSLAQSGGQVTISGLVSNTSSGGTCVAQFTTPNDRPVLKEAAGVVKGTSVNCGPMSIPELQFSFLGNWKATMSYYSNGTKVTSPEKDIVIQ